MTVIPTFLYGTAWKEDATESLVVEALDAGFRAIDTANQRKHYYEEGVGRAIEVKIREGFVRREELFLQTKFTFVDGQDQRLPYDPSAPITAQVAQSFESSLVHLGVTWIDSLVLHGPSRRDGLGPDDHAAWRAMEELCASGRVKVLGISNANAKQISDLVAFAKIRPSYVQNRCYANRGWDREVRAVCDDSGITYQAFSILTANRQVLSSIPLSELALRRGRTPEQLVFRFAQQVGMLPITGTRDPLHMREDLAIHDLMLDADELAVVNASGR